MYLYPKESLGQAPTSLPRCNLAAGSGRALGLAASARDGFGEAPANQEQLLREYRAQKREDAKRNLVVRTILRLPEGQVCPAPAHQAAHLQRIRARLQGSFDAMEIEKGIGLWLWLTMGQEPPPPPRMRPTVDTAPRMGPAEPQWRYDRGTAEHLDRLYRRATMGDDGAADDLGRAVRRIFEDRARLERIRRLLTELRSPAAIVLRVPPEPRAPTPDPPRRWWLPPRPARRR